jgi:hypothetical protein
MATLEKAFKYPVSFEGWGPKFVIGGVLLIIGATLGYIPWVGWILYCFLAIFPVGYAYRVFRAHLQGEEDALPGWVKWGELCRGGFFVYLIFLGYGILPAVLFWAGMRLWHAGAFAAFGGVLFIVLGIGSGLVALFLVPMALAYYAQEKESFRAAFRWNRIVEKMWVVQREYSVSWLAGAILFLILLFIRTHFLYVGWILYAFGVFYLALAMAYLFGRVCRESLRTRL